MKNWISSQCFALKAFPCRMSRRLLFGCKFVFCSCLFLSLLFFKKRFWEKLSIFFLTFDKLITFSTFLCYLWLDFFIYRHGYSFSSGKNCLFNERFILFVERQVQNKNKQLLLPDFSLNTFFWLKYFWKYFWSIGPHIIKERAKIYKK